MLAVIAYQYDDGGLPDPTGKSDTEFVAAIKAIDQKTVALM